MPSQPRSLEQLLEQQAHRWIPPGAQPRPRHDSPHNVVTISRQHGSGGGELARALASELGLQLFDREIVHRVAQSARIEDRVVSVVDERGRQMVTEWLSSFTSDSNLSSAGYHEHLARVIEAIARQGSAVIVGRGAHLILKPGDAVRVLVVAPLEMRVRAVMAREGIGAADAQRRIGEVDSARADFLRKHFRCPFPDDPSSFDLVVNTGVLGIPGAVAAVRAALPKAAAL